MPALIENLPSNSSTATGPAVGSPHNITSATHHHPQSGDGTLVVRQLPLEQVLADAELQARWVDLLHKAENGYAILHPEHVATEWKFWSYRPDSSMWQPRVIFQEHHGPGQHGKVHHGQWESLAVLLPRQITARRLTHLPLPVQLQGWHLVGGQILRTSTNTACFEPASSSTRAIFQPSNSMSISHEATFYRSKTSTSTILSTERFNPSLAPVSKCTFPMATAPGGESICAAARLATGANSPAKPAMASNANRRNAPPDNWNASLIRRMFPAFSKPPAKSRNTPGRHTNSACGLKTIPAIRPSMVPLPKQVYSVHISGPSMAGPSPFLSAIRRQKHSITKRSASTKTLPTTLLACSC